MIKKIGALLLLFCFVFAQNNITQNEIKTINKKDTAEVKEIEQKIIKEKYDEAQKELELKREQELQELKTKELNMQNIAQIGILNEKIAKITRIT